MTKTQEWAQKLNGLEYPADAIYRQRAAIKADGQIVAYGASDDLLEFSGVIDDELSAWNGTEARLTEKPDVFDEDINRETAEYNGAQIAAMPIVKATWCPKDGTGKIWASWEINTSIPHETFDIMEDGELFCRGIVFDAKELKGETK